MGKAILCMAVSAVLFGCLWEREVEVRVFELQRLDPGEVMALIEPYVYADREGNPGYFTVTENTLTVREMPENLARIAAVLERFDTPRSTVVLHFQIVAANGYEGSDPEIASVELELRKLLRYQGYKLLASTMLQVMEGEEATQSVIANEMPLEIQVHVGLVRGEAVELQVNVITPWDQVLQTAVNLPMGKTVVLGTGRNTPLVRGSPAEDDGALILIVTAEIS
ncbi:MAG: hypothetical protein IH968_00880 [Gemmatimonadetes bacterium]|nr:hypothetical protein [Gemmatimonadota bacterium]